MTIVASAVSVKLARPTEENKLFSAKRTCAATQTIGSNAPYRSQWNLCVADLNDASVLRIASFGQANASGEASD